MPGQIHAESHEINFSANEFGGSNFWPQTELCLSKLAASQLANARRVRLRYCHFKCKSCSTDVVFFNKLPGLEEVVVTGT